MSSSRDETRKGTTQRQVVSNNKGRMKGKGGPQNQEYPYRGVRQRTSGKWVAVIHDNTNSRHSSHWLGTFPTALEAALAYDDAARRIYGPKTPLNVPELVAEGDFDPNEVLFPEKDNNEEEEEEEEEEEDNDNKDGDDDDDNDDMHAHAQGDSRDDQPRHETAPVPIPTRTVIEVKVEEEEEEEAKSVRSDASVNSYAVAAGAGGDEFVAADLEDKKKDNVVEGVAKNPKCNESEWTLLK